MSTRNVVFVVLGILLVFSVTTVTVGKTDTSSAPTIRSGAPIEILNQDVCGAEKWIRVNDSATVSNILCTLTHKKGQSCPVPTVYISGLVLADKSSPDGWTFDAKTVRVAEAADRGAQTTFCDVSKTPAFYAGEIWYVGAKIAQWRPVQ
jgi:hypothetical protein